MAYNYLEELKSDVRNYIKEVASDYMDCEDMDELRDSLYDNLWDEDSVTGNGSGSYTFNREKAKEYVSDNMDLMDVFKELIKSHKSVNWSCFKSNPAIRMYYKLCLKFGGTVEESPLSDEVLVFSVNND